MRKGEFFITYIRTKLKKEISISHIVTIHYFEYTKDFVFQGESHDFWEFLYVDKGQVIVRAGVNDYELHTGDIIFHKPDEFHAIRTVGGQSPNLVAISFCSSSAAMKHFHQKYFTLSLDERLMISNIITEANHAFSTPLHIPAVEQVILSHNAPFGSQQLIILYLEMFMIFLKRNHLDCYADHLVQKTISPPANRKSRQQTLNEILLYLDKHICERLSIQHICSASSLSRSVIQNLFHTEYGCGVIDYFNQMKIDRAKEIIRDGIMNFTEIAHYLSYHSLQYFSKQFKKVTGMSPTAYASSVKGNSRLSGRIRKETLQDSKRQSK